MDAAPSRRDYSLVGRDAKLAVENGLASAEWYHTEIPRKQMKELMQRSDQPAIRDTIIWLGALIISAAGGAWFWGTWWCVPFFFVYGTLYGSSTDSRWHECGHGTAFRTQWMNDAVYQIACFMIMRNPVTWRWSHTRHHTDTIIVGRDPEIAVMRPPDLVRTVLAFVGILDAWHAMSDMLRNAAGNISAAEKTFIPEQEQPRAIRIARIWTAIYAATIALALYFGSFLPLMLVGLPRLYGAWHHVMTGLLQHGGLADNVTDHRLNSRTVYMNPISRFIYWNMNYHVEHHMFPMVPYHALSKLHEMIKHDLPAPTPSILAGYREMIPAFLRQLRYEDYFIKRELPPTARPYREDLHSDDPAAAAAE
ncbi:fatty acid desaturase [Mesorhizobium sp. M3A.F.Ca.ET.174.01.1.1]|nr:fatty acid desaturase [Mesorhizobium sp. M3A.F.Ca.ET.080.04.2.1]PBB88151.1 fatty acid desaturase [Mesorhizobium sp. WSM3876]RWB73869.1 MAG: fatty acid desaturase [Mesorhizobium sp.]TGS69500.1 fatty acid desaturase [Mesorhizobium sp. M3A.F.Ca.ET.201.01.1.1]TGS87279.1 fatty acid desaturase [Mesorhizobium sp. M3A.F.Ca.ET.175.01.1.1]TGT27110.1 fatty acid desaturase [Mesorhizobium sp. M3A.F.Ca.ET.174.01.1.1]TGT60876.1 fatty acid desaturase [Mesorhizobium sp. M00.F.Ca.ET.170.01.1.1]